MGLLVVGTLAFDSVETPFGRRDEVLGGSASYASVAASFFGPVDVCGVIGADFPAAHMDFFRGRGIDLRGVQSRAGRTFRWRGAYAADLNVAHTLETQLNVLEAFEPRLPDAYRGAPHVLLGNIHPEQQAALLDQLVGDAFVACDTMNFWIERHGAALKKTLRRVHLLSINEGEARQLSGEANLVRAAAAIRAMGPQMLVIKRGEYGALLFAEDEMFAAAAMPLADVCDPTGAGDTFAGGLMGALARQPGRPSAAALRGALVTGSIMASFVVEDFSLDRLRRLDAAQLAARRRAFARLTHYDVEPPHA